MTAPSICVHVPILPPELIDRIIDHLHKHKQSLRACTLVCRGWTPAARAHLFAFLDLSFCFRDKIDEFLEKYPYLSSYVKFVALDTRGGSFNLEGWRIGSLEPVISKFKNLTQLDILFLDPFVYLGFARTEATLPTSPVSPDEFPNLRTLSLGCYLSNSNWFAYLHVMNWFLSLPSLENLTIRDFLNGSGHVGWGGLDPGMMLNMIPSGDAKPQNPVHIKNLHIKCDLLPAVHILIAPVLFRLDADALKTLTFSFRAFLTRRHDETEFDQDDELGFRKLQAYFHRRPLPSIERVILRGSVGEEDVQNFLGARFAEFKNRGILLFDTTRCD